MKLQKVKVTSNIHSNTKLNLLILAATFLDEMSDNSLETLAESRK